MVLIKHYRQLKNIRNLPLFLPLAQARPKNKLLLAIRQYQFLQVYNRL